MNEPLVEVKHLRKAYRMGKRHLMAVDDVSFFIRRGETLGLVGESGSGKSTIGKCLLRLEKPTVGEVFYAQKNLLSLNSKELFALRRKAQIIFQDPYSSLNPRMKIADIIAEPLRIHSKLSKDALSVYVTELLEMVGLRQGDLERFPHEFSGGQRQRICIARALALKPEFIVCDEPISALDVSVQAQIVNLLKNLQKQLGLTLLFISHDLPMVKYISERIAVMYLGMIVELAPAEKLFDHPTHPYTQMLLASMLLPDPREKNRQSFKPIGEIPSAFQPVKGCPFASRCPFAQPKCHDIKPESKEILPGHVVACHLHS